MRIVDKWSPVEVEVLWLVYGLLFKKIIKRIQMEGLLTRVGPDKGGWWKVKMDN